MKIISLLFISLTVFSSCSGQDDFEKSSIQDSSKTRTSFEKQNNIITENSDSVVISVDRVHSIPAPKGFEKTTLDSNSFGYYLRHLTLKKDNTVYLFNGEKKFNQTVQHRVLDIDRGNKDLQQCADAVMRLRSDYLYFNQQREKIGFHFVSGDLCKYSSYANGYRPKINGSNVTWVKSRTTDTSYKAYRNYLDLVYMYAGTASLIKELIPKNIQDIEPGDVFIQAGNPYGHAMIVIDVAYNKTTNETAFMLAQSYMPAQDIHIVKNPLSSTNSPWFIAKEGSLITPEWRFSSTDLKTWPN